MSNKDLLLALKKPGRFLSRKTLEEFGILSKNHIPELLEILDSESNSPQDPNSREEINAYLYAMYFLAKLREEKALDSILKLYSRKGNFLNPLNGDIVLDNLAQILASVNVSISSTRTGILDVEGNEYTRAAMIESIAIQTYLNRIPREETFHFFKDLFHSLERENFFTWSMLAQCSTLLYEKSFSKEILSLFNEEFIDEIFLSREEVEEFWENPASARLNTVREKWHLIEDAIESMNWWANFVA